MLMTVTVKGQPVSFETPHTNAEALARIVRLTADGAPLGKSTFARDLASKALGRYGLSDRQWAWVHKLVVDAENPQPRPAGPSANLSAVVDLFDRAAANLKRPAITIDLMDGRTFRLSRCGPASSHAGAVNVTDGGGYGSGVWFGRIERDGSFTAGRQMADWIRVELETLAANPADYAAAYGQKSGRCCFCNLKLTDDRSTAVGYGRTCAKKFGMPWGAVPAEVPDLSAAPMVAA